MIGMRLPIKILKAQRGISKSVVLGDVFKQSVEKPATPRRPVLSKLLYWFWKYLLWQGGSLLSSFTPRVTTTYIPFTFWDRIPLQKRAMLSTMIRMMIWSHLTSFKDRGCGDFQQSSGYTGFFPSHFQAHLLIESQKYTKNLGGWLFGY